MRKTSRVQWEKIVVIFIFFCMDFILFAMFEKTKNSNFEIQNSKLENSKNKRKEEENYH